MPETKQDGTQTVTADSSIDEVVKVAGERSDAEAFGQEEPSPSEQDASEETGEVEKTQGEETAEAGAETEEAPKTEEIEGEEQELKDMEAKGEPIPYERFKKVIEQRNKTKDELASIQSEYTELQGALNDPDVLRMVLSKRGLKPDQINTFLKERGFEVKEPEKKPSEIQAKLKELGKNLNLDTQEGWAEYNYRIAQMAAKDVGKEQLGEYDKQKMTEAEAQKFVTEQEKVAKDLADKVYKIPYGEVGKDDKKRSPNTALGKIALYLDKNPEDAYLGQAKLLRLALSVEGFKLGEQKGVEKEVERHKKLKNAAMEGEEAATTEETPNANWPIQKILAWRRSHPNVSI